MLLKTLKIGAGDVVCESANKFDYLSCIDRIVKKIYPCMYGRGTYKVIAEFILKVRSNIIVITRLIKRWIEFVIS